MPLLLWLPGITHTNSLGLKKKQPGGYSTGQFGRALFEFWCSSKMITSFKIIDDMDIIGLYSLCFQSFWHERVQKAIEEPITIYSTDSCRSRHISPKVFKSYTRPYSTFSPPHITLCHKWPGRSVLVNCRSSFDLLRRRSIKQHQVFDKISVKLSTRAHHFKRLIFLFWYK